MSLHSLLHQVSSTLSDVQRVLQTLPAYRDDQAVSVLSVHPPQRYRNRLEASLWTPATALATLTHSSSPFASTFSSPFYLVLIYSPHIKKGSEGKGKPRLFWWTPLTSSSSTSPSAPSSAALTASNSAIPIKKVKFLRHITRLMLSQSHGQQEELTLTLSIAGKPYEFRVDTTGTLSPSLSLHLFSWSLLCCAHHSFQMAFECDGLDAQLLKRLNEGVPDTLNEMNVAQRMIFSSHNDPDAAADETASLEANPSTILLPVLTAQEATLLESYLKKYKLTYTNMSQLNEYLVDHAMLVQQNVIRSTIVTSLDARCKTVLQTLDEIIDKADEIAGWLSIHDVELHRMRQGIERIEARTASLEQQEMNHLMLQETLSSALRQMRLSSSTEQVLKHPNFDTQLDACLEAAATINAAIQTSGCAALMEMRALREQHEHLVTLRQSFAHAARDALEQAIMTSSSRVSANMIANASANSAQLSVNTASHSYLLRFVELLNMLVKTDSATRTFFINTYMTAFARMYEQKLRVFFADIRKLIQNEKYDAAYLSLPAYTLGQPLQRANRSSNGDLEFKLHSSASTNEDLLVVRGKQTAAGAFHQALSCVAPVIASEEAFLVKFFNLPHDSAEVNRLMSDMFSAVVPLLTELCNVGAKMNPFYALEMETISEAFVNVSPLHTSNYLSSSIHTLVSSQVKLIFNRYVDEQCAAISAENVSPKRSGVLVPFQQFPSFIARAEQSTASGITSVAADMAYNKLSVCLFRWLDVIARSDEKYTDVCWIENAGYLVKVLGNPNVFPVGMPEALRVALSRAQQSLDAHLLAYVNWNIEYELGVVVKYWNRLEESVQTISSEDVQHARDLSKHELRNITREKFNSKQASKHVHNMLARIRKHLVRNDAIIELVWNRLSSVLIERVKWFEEAIAQCYGDAEKSGVSSAEIAQYTRDAATMSMSMSSVK